MALVQLSAVPVLVRLQDGNKVEVMADSWTSVSDLEKQVCAHKPAEYPPTGTLSVWTTGTLERQTGFGKAKGRGSVPRPWAWEYVCRLLSVQKVG